LAAAQVEVDLAELYADTGIDLSVLPPVSTPAQIANALGITEGSLGQDRYRNRGITYVKFGRRVRYLRVDVARYLAAQRSA
jgi:hypothetical protein